MKSSRATSLLIALWACIHVGVFSGRTVLCVGLDGHMSLEPGRASCCTREAPSSSGENCCEDPGCAGGILGATASPFDPCGPCTDVPLFAGSEWKPIDLGIAFTLLPFLGAFPAACLPAEVRPLGLDPRTGRGLLTAAGAPTLARQRTLVLRC